MGNNMAVVTFGKRKAFWTVRLFFKAIHIVNLKSSCKALMADLSSYFNIVQLMGESFRLF